MEDARRNAELNGICNATFTVADLEKRMPKAAAKRPAPDVVITGSSPPLALALIGTSSIHALVEASIGKT